MGYSIQNPGDNTLKIASSVWKPWPILKVENRVVFVGVPSVFLDQPKSRIGDQTHPIKITLYLIYIYISYIYVYVYIIYIYIYHISSIILILMVGLKSKITSHDFPCPFNRSINKAPANCSGTITIQEQTHEAVPRADISMDESTFEFQKGPQIDLYML